MVLVSDLLTSGDLKDLVTWSQINAIHQSFLLKYPYQVSPNLKSLGSIMYTEFAADGWPDRQRDDGQPVTAESTHCSRSHNSY